MNPFYVKLYVASKFIFPLFTDLVYWKYIDIIISELKLVFYSDGWDLCRRIRPSDQSQISVGSWNSKKTKAFFAIWMMLDWGIFEIINFASSVTVCGYMFYKEDISLYGLILLGIVILVYTFFIKNKQKEYTKKTKETRNLRDEINVRNKVDMTRLMANIPGAKENLLRDRRRLNEMEMERNNIWKVIRYRSSFAGNIGYFVFPFVDISFDIFALMNVVFGKFANSVSNIINFVNRYETYQSDLNAFYELIDKVEIEEEFKQLEFKNEYVIKKEAFKDHGKNTKKKILAFSSLVDFVLGFKSRILLIGESGAGKTQILKMIIGLGLKYLKVESGGETKNYRDMFVVCSQHLGENQDVNKQTIRYLCGGIEDSERILKCIRTVCGEKIMMKIVTALKYKAKEAGEVLPLVNWEEKALDVKLCDIFSDTKGKGKNKEKLTGELSGGERSRLVLASCLVRVEEYKHCIVLDEPTADLDPVTAYRVIFNIFQMFPNNPIILILHYQTPELIIGKKTLKRQCVQGITDVYKVVNDTLMAENMEKYFKRANKRTKWKDIEKYLLRLHKE